MAIGTWQAYTTEAIETTLRDQVILPKLSDLITELMEKEKITILKLAPYYDEIGSFGKAKILDDFASYGLELVRFAVESINVPQEDESVKRLKKALADKAEIGIMGQDDYKMKRTFDTMEKAAGSDGMAGGMMGAGMGVGMGQQMAGMMGAAMGGATGQGARSRARTAMRRTSPGRNSAPRAARRSSRAWHAPSARRRYRPIRSSVPSAGPTSRAAPAPNAGPSCSRARSSAPSAARSRDKRAMSASQCPSCGAPVEIKNRFSKVLVCGYCGTHLRLSGDGFDARGQAPEARGVPVPVQGGEHGHHPGQTFYRHGQDAL